MMENNAPPTPNLRPHHALCALFFEGKGYDQTFIENMASFLSDPNRLVQISSNCDVLCQACPHFAAGICEDEDKASRFDQSVLELTLPLADTTRPIPLHRLCQVAHEAILKQGLLSAVCGECEWSALCQKKWTHKALNDYLLQPAASVETILTSP